MLVAVADLFVCARQAGRGQSISSCLLHSHLMLAHLPLEHHQQPPSNAEHPPPPSLPPSRAGSHGRRSQQRSHRETKEQLNWPGEGLGERIRKSRFGSNMVVFMLCSALIRCH